MLAKLSTVLQIYGPWGVFILALIDSMGVPLPGGVDVVLLGIGVEAVDTPSRAWLAALIALVGSLIGNAILFPRGAAGLKAAVLDIARTPRLNVTKRSEAWFRRYGLLTVFVPATVPLIPLPLKVFVISAGAFRTSFSKFMAVILVARGIHYFGMTYLALQLGADARRFLTRNVWTLASVALGFTFLVYFAMRWNERRATN